MLNGRSGVPSSSTRRSTAHGTGWGWYLYGKGRLQEAIVTLQRNIKLQPFSPYGYYQLGMTYHHLGRSVEAWKMYEKLTQFEPKYAATLKRDLNRPSRRQ